MFLVKGFQYFPHTLTRALTPNGMISMRVAYILALLASWCVSTVHCGDHPDGISSVSREQDDLGNYRFSYSIANSEGDQFRKEGTDALGRVVGSYGFKHVDGTHRVVEYVADKDGFRAEVRSNEPGVISAEAADASIIKTDHHDQPLTVAATNDDSRAAFGKRLHTDTSKVAYVASNNAEKAPDQLDETVRESRQQHFDDYRPLSPAAYYPSDGRISSGLLTPPVRRPVEAARSPRVLSQAPEADSKPLDVYFPPIDPHSARRPAYYIPRDRDTGSEFFSTTTSRRPFIPPYGGFDDDPLPENRRPVSMTTNHGGFGSARGSPTPAPGFASGRFPPVHIPDQRNFGLPRFPSSAGFPSGIPRQPGGVLPSFPQGIPQGGLFNPPSYDDRTGSPNVVLRAVPIPNGIQAVRVDPTTGHVYERLMYPLFLRHDGHPTYDRNILLHNDDVSDDDATRNDNSGYFDIPFPERPFRGARNQPFDDEEDRGYRLRRYNNSYTIDENNLSQPTAKDLDWIHQQLSSVEGFDRDDFDNRLLSNNSPQRISSYRIDENNPPYRNNRPSSRIRSFSDSPEFDFSNGEAFSRNPRHSDGLTAEDSKDKPKTLVESASSLKQIETEGNDSKLEKE